LARTAGLQANEVDGGKFQSQAAKVPNLRKYTKSQGILAISKIGLPGF
jgi:hypothetical protein